MVNITILFEKRNRVLLLHIYTSLFWLHTCHGQLSFQLQQLCAKKPDHFGYKCNVLVKHCFCGSTYYYSHLFFCFKLSFVTMSSLLLGLRVDRLFCELRAELSWVELRTTLYYECYNEHVADPWSTPTHPPTHALTPPGQQ